MNKETEVLYKIFELELVLPFTLDNNSYVYDKHSEEIAWYGKPDGEFGLTSEKEISILNKIRQTFNVDELSNDDVLHITKHLFNWLQDKFPEKIETVSILNDDTEEYSYYPN